MNSNNQMIQKGKISSVEGKADRNGDKTTARVLPSTADSMVTRPLTIPWYLRGEMGNLTPAQKSPTLCSRTAPASSSPAWTESGAASSRATSPSRRARSRCCDSGTRPVGRRDTVHRLTVHSHDNRGFTLLAHNGGMDRPSWHAWNSKTWGVSSQRIAALWQHLPQRRARHGKQRRQSRIPGDQDQGAQAAKHELSIFVGRRGRLRCAQLVQKGGAGGGGGGGKRCPIRKLAARAAAAPSRRKPNKWRRKLFKIKCI